MCIWTLDSDGWRTLLETVMSFRLFMNRPGELLDNMCKSFPFMR